MSACLGEIIIVFPSTPPMAYLLAHTQTKVTVDFFFLFQINSPEGGNPEFLEQFFHLPHYFCGSVCLNQFSVTLSSRAVRERLQEEGVLVLF